MTINHPSTNEYIFRTLSLVMTQIKFIKMTTFSVLGIGANALKNNLQMI